MEDQNYKATIIVSQSANKVFKSINSVSNWWTENLDGDSENLNGIFTVHFGADSFVTHKIIESKPDKKVVWLVTGCNLPWLKDKTEWTDTKMSFDIVSKDKMTEMNFTHIGLIPQAECFESCVKGWDQYIKGSLFNLITDGEGQPQKKN